ncbi:UPF0287 family protein [Trichophyton rubrum]|uniref:COX assembly mitochondrial protein n=2 Tax=Trichophyton TaxID=5550 RepID=A0A178EZP8_TRIRU|nr:UPF0287 family protein [Trichophyton rubrum]OAL68803.1 hypothetical protein A7D00_7293 [Trichophyton violaceum]
MTASTSASTLADHLDCEEVMTMLDECHAKGFMHKVFGNCNDIKREVNRCLYAERLKRASRNREKARENRARIEKLWDEDAAQGQMKSSS